MKRGFTLLEVMIATIILSVGLVVLITSFMNCQKVMMASQDFETAQYVLALGETAYPLPSPDQVTDDPIENELLNIDETSAGDLLDQLDISDMPREREKELEKYTFRREVDDVDVVPDAAAVGGRIVVAVKQELFPLAADRLQDQRDQMAFRTVVLAV